VIIGRQLHYDWDNKITVTRLNHILSSPTTPSIIYQSHCDLDRSTLNAMKHMTVAIATPYMWSSQPIRTRVLVGGYIGELTESVTKPRFSLVWINAHEVNSWVKV